MTPDVVVIDHREGEEVIYRLNWLPWLGNQDIASSSITDLSNPGGVVVNDAAAANTDTVQAFWVSGGAAGDTYRGLASIVTSAGETKVASIEIRVGSAAGSPSAAPGAVSHWYPMGPPGPSVYAVQLRFLGSVAGDDKVLAAWPSVIHATDPGVAHAGTPPASTPAAFDLRRNGVSVGGLSIATDGTVTWAIPSDVPLSAGDVLSLVSPTSPDAALADVLVALKAVVV